MPNPVGAAVLRSAGPLSRWRRALAALP
jgi:hypothetical protein